MTKRWNGLRTFHDRVSPRSGSKSAPASFRIPIQEIQNCVHSRAKPVAKGSASTGSRSVSTRYQRNCYSRSVSKRSERWTVISSIADKSDPVACGHHLCRAGYDDCSVPPGSIRPAPGYPLPDLIFGARRRFVSRHHGQLRWRYYTAPS